MERIGYWMKAMRAPLLSLPVALAFLGSAVAVYEGAFFPWRAGLAATGLVLLQASLMFFNDYSDFHSGIDYHTNPTPFSGGSGMVTAGKITPSAMYLAGVLCLLTGAAVLLSLVWMTDVRLLPLLVVGIFAVCAYTDHLHRHAMAEIFTGLTLGLLPVMGACFVHTLAYSASSVAAGVVAGILSFNLLLLCEFPDLEADIQGGRRNLLMVIGNDSAGKLYVSLNLLMYVWIAGTVAAGLLPTACLAALATIVIAWKPMRWAWNMPGGNNGITRILTSHVVMNLAVVALLGIGFLVSVPHR